MPASLSGVGILSLNAGMQPSQAEQAYWNNHHRKSRGRRNYNQNDGKPGVVYILAYDAANLLKIGQSTRSAATRARELNENCGTENPGNFSVLHEVGTADCGRAEKRVHKTLKKHRLRKDREFFAIDVATALEAVREACAFFDKKEEEKQCGPDATRKASEEVLAKAVTHLKQPTEKPSLTPDEEAAIYAGLSATDEHSRATPKNQAIQQKPTPAPTPSKSAPVETSTHHPPVTPPQAPTNFTIAACPSCRQGLRVPIAENLILTCPTCRYSFQRTSSGQIFSHNIQTPTRSKTSASSGAYVLAALAIGVWLLVAAGGGGSSEVTTTKLDPSSEERRLLADIKRYVANYQIPIPEPKGETDLSAITHAGKLIQFTYSTTPTGERALSKNLDWPHIQDGMRTIACGKSDLRALMKRGAVVRYQLQRKNGAALTTTIMCE